ncbi:MAG: hypothetical protein KC506_02900 [Nanoarchaeota archaeon]|nr:hypothetical protein [Nanoarchaeota archaeon]
MINAILFDLGDTVIANDWKARNHAVKEETGLDLIWTPEIKEFNNEVVKGKKLMKDLFQKIIDNDKLKVSAETVVESYTKNYAKYCPVNEKMIILVDKLRSKIKMYALSNTNDIHKKVNIERGVYNHFDKSFLSLE